MSGPSCNCEVWVCTCNGTWRASSGRFCHRHGTPHPRGLMGLWQNVLLWLDRRAARVKGTEG